MSRRQLGRYLLLVSCFGASGCSLIAETSRVYSLAGRTIHLEAEQFPYIRSKRLAWIRNRSIAKRVWNDVLAENPEGQFSKHYRRGFITGFADYLYAGGTGEPPPVPPRDYWRRGYQTPSGRQAIQDWFEGFRHGSLECQSRGYREMGVVPSSVSSSANHLTQNEQPEPLPGPTPPPLQDTSPRPP